jgi:hypothetical protein
MGRSIAQVWEEIGSSDKVFEGVSVHIDHFGPIRAIGGRTSGGQRAMPSSWEGD